MKTPGSGQRNNGLFPLNWISRAREKTAFILTSGFLAVVFLLNFTSSCKNDVEKVLALDVLDTLPEVIARNVEIIYSEKGRSQIKLISPLLVNETDQEKMIVFPEGFTVYFYDSLMNLQSTISADYGISWEKKKLMEARHNVVVQNIDKGETLNTEELFWDQNKEIIYSYKFVKLTTGEQVIYGDTLISVQPFNELEIRHPKGLIEVREEPEK